MIRENGGGDMDSPLGGLRPPRNASSDYYPLPGWQSHSPSGRLDLEALPPRMLASVPPLSKSPFTAASLSRRSVLSPSRTYPSAMESSLDRDSALYSRGPLSADYRGSADLIYSSEQPPPPPLSIPTYHSSKDAGYLGLTCPDSSGGSLYGRSVLENSLFNRSLSMASLPSNPNLIPDYRSHLSSSGENFSMEHPLERKFVFGASHTPSPLLPAHPYNRLLENYSHPTEHMSSAVKTNLDGSAAERTPHYTSPLPSHVAFSTGSSYISRNPPLYPFAHLSSSFPPENYTSYASTLNHLSSYSQLSVPPPAHSRAHDAVAQRSSFAEEGTKQTAEGSVGQPFDATISRDFTVTPAQWDHSSVSEPKRENSMAPFDGQASNPDGPVADQQCSCYQDSQDLPLPKEEDALEQLMGNQFVVVGSQEKMVPLQSESCNQTSGCNPCQMDGSWSMTDVRYTQSTAGVSSVNGTHSAQSPPVVDINTNKRSQQQPQSAYTMNSSQNTATSFLPCPESAAFPAKFSSPASSTSCSFTPSRNNPNACRFPETGLYSGSNDSDADSDLEFKFQASQAQHKGNRFVSIAPSAEQQSDRGFPYALMGRSRAKECSVSTETKTSKKQSLQYDSSTSEYEPPSPYQEPAKKRKRGRKAEVTVRRQTFTTSFQEDSDEAHADMHPSKIKLTIKTERVSAVPAEKAKAMPKSRKMVVQRKQRKKGMVQSKEKQEVKKNNRTCPLCLKTFSRADSLTCHMRVHTGDRPYRCDQCAASYKVSSHLRDHIRSKHSDAKPFECEKCGKPFTYSTARRRHEKICGKDLTERVEFQCTSCQKGFVTAKGFSKHQEKCGTVRPDDDAGKGERQTYKCKNCRKVFDSVASLDGHQRFFCGKTKNHQVNHFSCGECGKAFFKRNLYIVHMRHHAWGKPFRCVQCEGCFYDRDSLKQHMEQHSGNAKYKCSMCDSAFFLKRCLSLHVLRVHGGLKPYKCKECEWDFSTGYHLCRHLRIVHRQVKQFRYVLVGKGYGRTCFWMKIKHWHPLQPRKGLRGHTARCYTCKFCSRSSGLQDMRCHVTTAHPGVTLREALSTQLARCGICSKDFSCQESLHVHRLRHKGKKPFHCSRCNMVFLLKSALRLHQRKHADCPPLSCPECDKMFHWHASLRQHMVAHHGHKAANGEQHSKGFACSVCGKHFKQQIFLNVHMKHHRLVMPNTCTQCGKAFVDLRHLRLHMARHEGPKSFVCEKCGAAFSRRPLLHSHVKRKHTERPKQSWLCDECGKCMGRRDSLQKHLALHAKYQSTIITKKGSRKGYKTAKRREWSKTTTSHKHLGMTANTPFSSGQEDGGNSRFPVAADVYGMSEADLVELKPANFIPPNIGASPSFGVIPNFSAGSRYSTNPSFAAPPGFGQQHSSQQQFSYQYRNTYATHNIPCPTVANH